MADNHVVYGPLTRQKTVTYGTCEVDESSSSYGSLCVGRNGCIRFKKLNLATIPEDISTGPALLARGEGQLLFSKKIGLDYHFLREKVIVNKNNYWSN